jgi:hypothetical protein
MDRPDTHSPSGHPPEVTGSSEGRIMSRNIAFYIIAEALELIFFNGVTHTVWFSEQVKFFASYIKDNVHIFRTMYREFFEDFK